jgi:asparagine synthase (glutamine-hydrolysing)
MVQREWTDYDAVKTTKQVYLLLKKLEAAVHRQLMSDVPYGMLSGGLDSSVTSAIAKKYAQRIESGDVADAWYPQYTLSVGLEGWLAGRK